MKRNTRRRKSDPFSGPISSDRLAKLSDHSLRMVFRGCMIGIDLCHEDASKFTRKAKAVLQELAFRQRKGAMA